MQIGRNQVVGSLVPGLDLNNSQHGMEGDGHLKKKPDRFS
jgi:hypothetical protein